MTTPDESPDASDRLRRDRERDYARTLERIARDRARREKGTTDGRG